MFLAQVDSAKRRNMLRVSLGWLEKILAPIGMAKLGLFTQTSLILKFTPTRIIFKNVFVRIPHTISNINKIRGKDWAFLMWVLWRNDMAQKVKTGNCEWDGFYNYSYKLIKIAISYNIFIFHIYADIYGYLWFNINEIKNTPHNDHFI